MDADALSPLSVLARLLRRLEPPKPQPELILGRYRLQAMVDVGSTAVLYRGRSVRGGAEVAIKVLTLTDPKQVPRFIREVEILKRLSHPGIVRFITAGRDGGHLYLVEELAPRGNLRQALLPDGMPVERFVPLFKRICEAVAYAHGQGVVHRDLKPENILVVDDLHVKIADFGLARCRYMGAITTTATTLGTPVYMAPEQVTGLRLTPAADQYALGVLGYEMLVGTTPFAGGERLDVLTRHLYEAAEPPSHRKPVPPELDDILLRMLAKAPEERFQSLDEVLLSL
ncbi:MAG TPA: serine/threonine-protein kinase [Candidatus Xenobia bacterium]